MIRALKLFFLAVALGSVWWWFHPKTCPPGVLIASDPRQTPVDEAAASFDHDGFTLKPLARYELSVRVLHTKRYYGGEAASLGPYDFAVGWGAMSDQHVLDQLKISQGNRFYFYEWARNPPIPQDQIACHSANMHLIPADSSVANSLRWTSAGDLIHMEGLLVEATLSNGGHWRSSLSRTDAGNGACELMFVQSIGKVLPDTTGSP